MLQALTSPLESGGPLAEADFPAGRARLAQNPKLRLVNLVKRFGTQTVVDGLSVDIAEGRLVVLLGPSGCGKTTTLRLIAGLLQPDSGSVFIDDREVAGPGWGVPPERRNLAMVFQSFALWPHKTVFENVAYGLRVRRLPREEIRSRVQRTLAMLHMADLGDRYPAELSGGQQQRVALARAIVVEPAMLLLDEPLSNLDAVLREEMRAELKTLQRQLGLTFVYVTHDRAEALLLADYLVVMRAGVIEQQGGPEEMYRRPRSRFVAGLLGAANVVDGRIVRLDQRKGCLETPGVGSLWAHMPEAIRGQVAPGDRASLCVRPVDIMLSALPPEGDGVTKIRCQVVRSLFLGELEEYTVQAGDLTWKVHIAASGRFSPGQSAWISFAHDAATLMVDAWSPATGNESGRES